MYMLLWIFTELMCEANTKLKVFDVSKKYFEKMLDTRFVIEYIIFRNRVR